MLSDSIFILPGPASFPLGATASRTRSLGTRTSSSPRSFQPHRARRVASTRFWRPRGQAKPLAFQQHQNQAAERDTHSWRRTSSPCAHRSSLHLHLPHRGERRRQHLHLHHLSRPAPGRIFTSDRLTAPLALWRTRLNIVEFPQIILLS